MTTEKRKKRADTIREIRRLARKLIGQHERDKHIAEHRKKTIKVVIDNEKKPLITKEGSYFAIDGHAIEECIRKILINNYKKAKKINPDIQTPLEHDINEEVKTWTSLGKHPQIYDAALKSYKKGMLACMDALAKLCNDKTLEFGRPITKAIKNFFKGIF